MSNSKSEHEELREELRGVSVIQHHDIRYYDSHYQLILFQIFHKCVEQQKRPANMEMKSSAAPLTSTRLLIRRAERGGRRGHFDV